MFSLEAQDYGGGQTMPVKWHGDGACHFVFNQKPSTKNGIIRLLYVLLLAEYPYTTVCHAPRSCSIAARPCRSSSRCARRCPRSLATSSARSPATLRTPRIPCPSARVPNHSQNPHLSDWATSSDQNTLAKSKCFLRLPWKSESLPKYKQSQG